MSVQPTQTMRCGDSWIFTGSCINQDGSTPNLAGAAITFKLDSLDFSTNYLTLVLGQGITILTDATATIQYGPTDEQTDSIVPGTYYYTVQVEFPDGVTAYTYFEGMIIASNAPA